MSKPAAVALTIVVSVVCASAQVGPLEYCTVKGRVTDEMGRLLKGARVEIRPAAMSTTEQPQQPFSDAFPSPDERAVDSRRDKDVFAWGVSDQEGWYHIAGVKRPGAYMLLVRGVKGYHETRVPLSIAASVGDEFRADVVLQRLPGKTTRTSPGEYEAAMAAAHTAESAGDLATAMSHLEVAARFEPDSPAPHYHLARLALGSGETKRAHDEAELAVARKADCVDCWIIRAKVERAAHSPGHARQAAERAISLAPDNPAAYGAMGCVLYEEDQVSEALQYLDAAVAGGDPDPNVHLYLANAYVQLRQPQAAYRTYRSFLERFPEAPNRSEVERVMASLAPPFK